MSSTKSGARKRKVSETEDEAENLLDIDGEASRDTQRDAVATIKGIIEKEGSFRTQCQDLAEAAADGKRESVVATVVNLITACCGVTDARVEEWQVELNDPKRLMVELCDTVPLSTAEKYPFATKDKKNERFRYNYQFFWKELTKQFEAKEVLYDREFTRLLLEWLGGMCNTRVRAFRHQAVVAVYSMMSALCKLAVELDSLAAQLASDAAGDASQDKKKGGRKPKPKRGKKATLRGKDAETETARKIEEVRGILETLCDISFVVRHKDVLADIRALSMQSLSQWIVLYPSLFLSSDYTKMLGWGLHDRDEGVRFQALSGLEKIYSTDGTYGPMKPFTMHFKQRILESAFDTSRQNCTQALQLAKVLSDLQARKRDEIFAPSVQEGFLELVFDERQTVRRTAGALYSSILARRATDGLAKQASKEAVARKKLQLILRWLCTSTVSNRETAADSVVEALAHDEALHGSYPSVFSHFDLLAEIALSDVPHELLSDSAADAADATPKKKRGSAKAAAEQHGEDAGEWSQAVFDEDSADLVVSSALSLLLAICKAAAGKIDLKLPIKDDPAATMTKARKTKFDAQWTSREAPKSMYNKVRAWYPQFAATMSERCKTNPVAVSRLCGMFTCIDVEMWSEGGTDTEELLLKRLLPTVRDCFFIATDDSPLVDVCWVFKALVMTPNAFQAEAEDFWKGAFDELMKGRNRTKGLPLFWKRLAIAIEEVPCPFLAHDGRLWSFLVAQLQSADLRTLAYAGDVVSAATSLLFLRTYAHREKGESEGIDLQKDYPDVALSLARLLDDEDGVAPLEVKERAYHALGEAYTIGKTEGYLSKVKDATQKNLFDTFSLLVPDCPRLGQMDRVENARIEHRAETALILVGRLWAMRIVDSSWLSHILIKWPNLHSKGQDLVKGLHTATGSEAWKHEAAAIKEANRRYLSCPEEAVEDAEQVLNALCLRLSHQHQFKADRAAVLLILKELEAYAAESTDNYYVLYAASPFVRNLDDRGASELLQRIAAGSYDTSGNMAVCVSHFMTLLQKRKGGGGAEEPKASLAKKETQDDEDEEGKKEKEKKEKKKKQVIKGSRYVASTETNVGGASTSANRRSMVTRLDYDDSDDEDAAGAGDNELIGLSSQPAPPASPPKTKKPGAKKAAAKKAAAKKATSKAAAKKAKQSDAAAAAAAADSDESSEQPPVPSSPESASGAVSSLSAAPKRGTVRPAPAAAGSLGGSSVGAKKVRLSNTELSFCFDDPSDDDDEDESSAAVVSQRPSRRSGSAAAATSQGKPAAAAAAAAAKVPSQKSQSQGFSQRFDDDDDDDDSSDAAEAKSVAQSHATQESVADRLPRRRRRGGGAAAATASPTKSASDAGDDDEASELLFQTEGGSSQVSGSQALFDDTWKDSSQAASSGGRRKRAAPQAAASPSSLSSPPSAKKARTDVSDTSADIRQSRRRR